MGFGFGDVLNIVGVGLDIYSKVTQADAVEEQGEDQAAEIKRVADLNAADILWAAEQNAALSAYDAAVLRTQAGITLADAAERARIIEYDTTERIRQHMNQVNEVIGQSEVNYSKAGVWVGGGSPLDVMANSAFEGMKDADNIKWQGSNAKRAVLTTAASQAFAYGAQAERAERGADVSLGTAARQAALIQEVAAGQSNYVIQAAQSKATAINYSAIGSGIGGLYNSGVTAGWWG